MSVGVRMLAHVVCSRRPGLASTGRFHCLPAYPCALRRTCGFSVGVPVVSGYRLLCVRVGGLKEGIASKLPFQTSIQAGPKTQSENDVRCVNEICY